MRSNDDIEKRLTESPLPRLQDGPHRAALKQSLREAQLADLNKETVMNEKTPNASTTPATSPSTKRRRLGLRWVIGSAVAATIAVVVVGLQTYSRAPSARMEYAEALKKNISLASPKILSSSTNHFDQRPKDEQPLTMDSEGDTTITSAPKSRRTPLLPPVPQNEGLGKDGMGKDGMGKDGMGKDGMGKDGMGKDGRPKDAAEKNEGRGTGDRAPDGKVANAKSKIVEAAPPLPPRALEAKPPLGGALGGGAIGGALGGQGYLGGGPAAGPAPVPATPKVAKMPGDPKQAGDKGEPMPGDQKSNINPRTVTLDPNAKTADSAKLFGKVGGMTLPETTAKAGEGKDKKELEERLSLHMPVDQAQKLKEASDQLLHVQRHLPSQEANDPSGDKYSRLIDNPYHKALTEPLSTFSVDVDTASYTNVRRYLTQENRLPPKDSVRLEEMVNYFVYDDPRPTDGKPVAIKAEVGPCPWNAKHKLVRVGLRAKSVSAEDAPPRNLVFLVDTSGSMTPEDRLPLFKKGLAMLIETLRPQDRVAIVAYAGSAGLVLQSTAGTEKKTIHDALNRLGAGGSTNGGEGIALAYKVAQESFIKDGVNRVILGTDGDFNVGVTTQDALVKMIEQNRKSGILLSILGFGHGNLKDATMEKLAHHGNGHYAYVDTLEECHRIFVEQGAAMQVVAYDVKVQVEFNPAKVAAYRLVGYENRLMKHEDFNNDKKDAGDMGSGHTVTAIYEIVPAGADAAANPEIELRYQKPQTPVVPPPPPVPNGNLTDAANSNELMLVKVKYKDPGETVSKLITQPVQDVRRPLAETSNDFRFASAVAEFALLLRESPYKGTANLANVIEQARGSLGLDPNEHRSRFVEMVQAAQRIKQ